VRADDFFVLDDRSERVLIQGVLVDLIADSLPLASDASVAYGLLDLVHHELVAYGTDGSNKLDDKEIRPGTPSARGGHLATAGDTVESTVSELHHVPLVLNS
jgi:hypothetical protein